MIQFYIINIEKLPRNLNSSDTVIGIHFSTKCPFLVFSQHHVKALIKLVQSLNLGVFQGFPHSVVGIINGLNLQNYCLRILQIPETDPMVASFLFNIYKEKEMTNARSLHGINWCIPSENF